MNTSYNENRGNQGKVGEKYFDDFFKRFKGVINISFPNGLYGIDRLVQYPNGKEKYFEIERKVSGWEYHKKGVDIPQRKQSRIKEHLEKYGNKTPILLWMFNDSGTELFEIRKKDLLEAVPFKKIAKGTTESFIRIPYCKVKHFQKKDDRWIRKQK